MRKDVLIGIIRQRLKEISTDTLTELMLYDIMNLVQGDIMRRKWCNEKSFTITMVSGTGSYDFADEEVYLIKEIYPSWVGRIILKSNQEWIDYKDATGQYPGYATIFNRSLYLAPTPTTTDTITIWGYQTEVLTPIDATHDPEIPTYLDDALIWGTCAKWDIQYMPFYEQALQQAMNPNIKSTLPKVTRSQPF